MKNIALIGDFHGEHNIIKSYLEEMNAKYLEVSTVRLLLNSTAMPDMIIILARKSLDSLNEEIGLLKNEQQIAEIPRLVILPRAMSDFGPGAELISVGGEPAFQVPIDKLIFLSALAKFLKIPYRRVFRIIITIQPDGSNIKYSGMSLDFSETGMSFQCVEDISVGHSLSVFFVNPKNRKRVGLRAVVARKTPTRTGGANFYGVKFADLKADDLKELQAFITGKTLV